MEAPRAKQVPYELKKHGDVRIDPYYWLNDKTSPDVIQYLESENAYHAHHMEPLHPMVDWLTERLLDRVPDAEENVPVKGGRYFYYHRQEKALQYPIYIRKPAERREDLQDAPEEVLLNLNDMVDEDEYLSVTVQRVSPDETRLAFLENRDGSDRYTLVVKDLESKEILEDTISDIFLDGSLEWDATGTHLFYVTVDQSQRPYQLWRHRMGDQSGDTLVYEEKDDTFSLVIDKSNSGRFLFIESQNKVSTEIRWLDAEDPLGPLHLFQPREVGIEYAVEHWHDDFLMLTNKEAKNFRVQTRPVANEQAEWTDLFPYHEGRYLQRLHPFKDGLVIEGREDGRTELWVYANGLLTQLHWENPVYSVSIGEYRSYVEPEVLVRYESLLTPRITYAYDLNSGQQWVLQQTPVAGPFTPSDYVEERMEAIAPDGVSVPMFAVYRRNALDQGPAPTILYAYGSYGANTDPWFDSMRLPLLDLGVVLVWAQIRGGSEKGYTWYEDGKWLRKRNTFTDFIAAAKSLIERGYTTPVKLAARGGSAGGLLMGAVVNMAPELFQAVHAAVPFVDVVTTMSDPTIPLTTSEYDEWGNPDDETYYRYMKSYSPYDNVTAQPYPHLLVTAGLNDPRVGYFEPAKWVARLREHKTDDHLLLLKTNMGSGHFGSSGRVNRIREKAAQDVFLLDKIGVKGGSHSK